MMAMPETYVYKRTPVCAIHLDVHRPDESNGHVIVWIHGGALINGSRQVKTGRVRHYLDAGYTVFSIDYRLAPETKLPTIIEDVCDALAWIRTEGATVADVGPARMGIVGHSAGGYLSLITGTFDAPPNAIVAFYGYGDILGDWYAEPSDFYRTSESLVAEEDAWAVVRNGPVSNGSERSAATPFYLYCRQHGTWLDHVGGVNPKHDRDFFVRFCPEFNVSSDYPPTLMLHGTDDTDVPYEQSAQMAATLEKHGRKHELITILEGGHGFEGKEKDPQVIAAWPRVIDFLKEHV